jgi:Fe2+ or Zn2+ uptake regulation protein
MNNNFHNTTAVTGEQYARQEQRARNQNELILELFKRQPSRLLTPRDVWRQLGCSIELTSVRRAINYLTRENKIVKTKFKQNESAGAVNFCWYFKPVVTQINIFES